MRHTMLGLPALAVALVACGESATGPNSRAVGVTDRATQYWESGASVYWNAVARDLVVKYSFNAFQAIRGYAALSVAQYNGIVGAEDVTTASGRPASPRAAAVGASVVVLAYLFPAEASALEDLVEQQLASPSWPGESQTDVAAGEAAGRTGRPGPGRSDCWRSCRPHGGRPRS